MCDMLQSVASFLRERLILWEVDEAWVSFRRDLSRHHVVGIALTILSICAVGSYIRGQRRRAAVTRRREKKQAERQRAFEAWERKLLESSLVTPAKIDEITGLGIAELISQLQTRKLSSSQVMEAYQKKALEAQNKTNCLVEPLLNAKEAADKLDFNEHGKSPLYGVPISVKDCFGLTGYDCTIGCASWIDRPFSDDAVLVKILKKQGAIPFVKTNIPQTMISWESTNPIFGRTTNPHDTLRSAGGSSGGEAALIAAGGSILGIGSDIGGSLRIPASFCGICSLKPTSNRLSMKGTHPILAGQTNVGCSSGPMSNSVEGLVLFMKAVLVPEFFRMDPTIPFQLFREDVLNDKKPLTIGYFEQNGIFETIPAMVRGVKEAKKALEAMGHKVVPWHCLETMSSSMIRLWFDCVFADGVEEIVDLIRDDVVDDSFDTVAQFARLPRPIKKLLTVLMPFIDGAKAPYLKACYGMKDVTAYWNARKEIKAIIAAVIADWQSHQLDGIICPTLGTVAVPSGTPKHLMGVTTYCTTFNILDFSAGTLPVSKVTASDEAAMDSYPMYTEMNSNYQRVKQGMKGIVGLPINVQVVTLPWQEELCLRIMRDIETGLKLKRN